MLLTIVCTLIILLFATPLLFTLLKAQPSRKTIISTSILAITGVLLAIVLVISLDFISKFFWFLTLHQSRRFLTVFFAKIILFIAGTLIIALFLLSLQFSINRNRKIPPFTIAAICSVAFFFGFWPAGLWNEFLLFIYQVQSPLKDPVFGQSTSFYLFSLPLVSGMLKWFFAAVIAGFVTLFFPYASNVSMKIFVNNRLYGIKITGQILLLTAMLFFLIGCYLYIQRYYLLYNTRPVLTGAGYTDIHVKRFIFLAFAIISYVISLLFLVSIFSEFFRKNILFLTGSIATIKPIVILSALFVLFIISVVFVPSLIQNLVVSPNEITLEKPYIKNNIDLTRSAYGITENHIHNESYPIGRTITSQVANDNISTLKNIRIWDWKALLENLRQQQEIRLYYRFNDADVDRYVLDGKYTQVMLAVRELSQEELDPRSKNWVSLHLKYTHGFGAVLLPAHDIISQGKPDLLIHGIPPQSSTNSLTITQPRIYYGELTDNYIFVKTTEPEFDYPSAQKVEYNFYSGTGGVPIGSYALKFLYALWLDDYRLLISSYFTDSSKVLFYRNIQERAQILLPFLSLDKDPYPVITGSGRIVWIIDAYTTSDKFPYSQTYEGFLNDFHDINYIRNSVKIIIDAYNGTVEPYIVDSNDVIISTYNRIFPGLFKNFYQMPQDLQRHIRYPVDLFTIQTEMYSAFHMTNPETFYQREDLWQYATERYRAKFQPVVPYYVMIEFPHSDSVQFALIVPFTPRNKNVMNAWMAGLCDIPNYGNITVYPFPQGIEVLGPRQIEAQIDQNTTMSQYMTLWGQKGSEVIRGNLLVIPLFYQDTLFVLYVEPVIIQAEEAKLPEIKRIIVADQNQVVWSEQFDDAISLLIQGETPSVSGPQTKPNEQNREEYQKLKTLLQEFITQIGKGSYAKAGELLEQLRALLKDQNQGF